MWYAAPENSMNRSDQRILFKQKSHLTLLQQDRYQNNDNSIDSTYRSAILIAEIFPLME